MRLPEIITLRSGGSNKNGKGELVSIHVEEQSSSSSPQEEQKGLLGQSPSSKNYSAIQPTWVTSDGTRAIPQVVVSKGQHLEESSGTNWKGILLAFCSGVFFTLCSGSVKYLKDISPMELLVIRSLFQVAVLLPIALYRRENLLGPSGFRLLLLGQGLVGGTTLALLFYAFRTLPLGDAATIIFSSPVFVMLMSHIWLREPCGLYRTSIVCLLVSGVVLISKPPFLFPADTPQHEVHFTPAEHHHEQQEMQRHILGYVAALLGTVFTAINIVIMRKCKEVHYSVVVFQFSFWSLVLSAILVFALGHYSLPKTTTDWVLVMVMSTFGMSGQVLVAKALSLEGAGRVAVTRSMDIVLAYVIQVIIFGEIPDCYSILGALLVMVCVVAMGLEDLVISCFKTLP